LRLAGEQHGEAAVERLLALGYPVDAAGSDGRTALHEAALRGDDGLCARLLTLGADPAVRDRDYDATPADWAAHSGHAELADRLRRASG
jgi:ankyrin repeat protein